MTMFGLKKTLLLSLALLLPSTTALNIRDSTEGIQWGPCAHDEDAYPLPVVCGNASVPLDYTNTSSCETLVLQLTRVPALKGPSKGSILFNFGGPGQEAQTELAREADYFMNATGGEHDLVAFDPRTGTTIPFSCYENATEQAKASLQYPDVAANSSDVAMGRMWAHANINANTCAGAPGNETAELIGTAFVARDFMSVVDALDEDGMLRYWGISYGTVLGATIASMFPDRIGRLVLDGVSNSHEYYHGYQSESITDADELFSVFLKECISSPNCPLARGNTTSIDLEAKLYDFFYKLKYEPIVFDGYLFDYKFVKSITYRRLYYPEQWPKLAGALDSLLTGNLEALIEDPELAESIVASIVNPALPGIACGDSNWRTTDLDDIRPHIESSMATSKLGGDIVAIIYTQCPPWPFAAKERYEGDFTAKTNHPVLLVGSTLDPVTPLVSARNMSAGFEGSVVLQHDGYGHGSNADPSDCTNNAIREYFHTGKLPEPGTVCEVNDREIFKLLDGSGTALGPN